MAIRTIAASGGDFTTLAAWEATLPATLLEDEIAEITGAVDATGAATSFSSVTSTTARIIIRATSGQETTYTSTDGKAKIEFANFDFRWDGGAKNVHWEKVAIGLNGSFQSMFGTTPVGSDWRFNDCYFFRRVGAATAIMAEGTQNGITWTNCLIFGLRNLPSGVTWTNCSTVADVVVADLGGPSIQGTATAIRTYAANNTNQFGHFRIDTATDIATSNANQGGTNTPDVINAALLDQYVDPANGDWSFKAGNILQGAAAGGADIGFVLPTGGGGPSPITGTIAAGLAGLSATATGTLAITGAIAASTAPAVASSAGSVTVTGTGAVMAAALQGSLTGGLSITGIGAGILPALRALALEGEPTAISGMIAATLSALAADATGDIQITGQGDVGLAALVGHAVGGVTVIGSIDARLAAIMASGDGVLEISGQIAGLLPGITSDGTATVSVTGAIAAVVAALRAAGSDGSQIVITPDPRRTIVIKAGSRTLTVRPVNRTITVAPTVRGIIVGD